MFEPMIEEVCSQETVRDSLVIRQSVSHTCTLMLYSALATVLVRTVPALRLVIATMMAWAYG